MTTIIYTPNPNKKREKLFPEMENFSHVPHAAMDLIDILGDCRVEKDAALLDWAAWTIENRAAPAETIHHAKLMNWKYKKLLELHKAYNEAKFDSEKKTLVHKAEELLEMEEIAYEKKEEPVHESVWHAVGNEQHCVTHDGYTLIVSLNTGRISGWRWTLLDYKGGVFACGTRDAIIDAKADAMSAWRKRNLPTGIGNSWSGPKTDRRYEHRSGWSGRVYYLTGYNQYAYFVYADDGRFVKEGAFNSIADATEAVINGCERGSKEKEG